MQPLENQSLNIYMSLSLV